MDEESTKWINEISVKYKDIVENYKNIEMFQNIYSNPDESNNIHSDSELREGFKIFDDFDIHKKPKNAYSLKGIGPFFELLSAIKDYILCPFYKSDELVDTAIQSVLDIFLEVNCDKESIQESKTGETDDPVIIDISNLIQPDLLYKETFKNKKKKNNSSTTQQTTNNSTQQIKPVPINQSEIDCKNKKEKAKKDSNRYKRVIKNELYTIICIPIIIHILYNIYFLFFFKDALGVQPEFINIEEKYYDPYFKNLFSYFLDIPIKPITYLYRIFNYVSKHELLHLYSDKYPYVFFISIYVLLYLCIASYSKNPIAIIGDTLTMRVVPALIISFCTIIVAYEFCVTLKEETFEVWPGRFKTSGPIIGLIYYLMYWILRLCFTIMMLTFSSMLCMYYIIVYMIFGIQYSQSKDTFDVYSDIDNSIYDKIYKIFNPDCDPYNGFKIFIQFISKYSFVYLTEITIFLILYYGFYNYGAIDNANVLSFLYILNFTGIFILFIWSFAKYKSYVKPLDAKFDLLKK
jgi:hypothetical protein